MRKRKRDQDNHHNHDDDNDDDDHDSQHDFDTLSQYSSSESLRDERFIRNQSRQRNSSQKSRRYYSIIDLLSIYE